MSQRRLRRPAFRLLPTFRLGSLLLHASTLFPCARHLSTQPDFHVQ